MAPSTPAVPSKILRLAELRERMEGVVCSGAELAQGVDVERCATGLAGVDEVLDGGLCRGGLTEAVVSGGGGGVLLAGLLRQARHGRRYSVLIDAGDGFDPAEVPESDLECLLWVRCRGAQQAVQALDVLSRDENFPLLLLDLRGVDAREVGGIRLDQWQRLKHNLRVSQAMMLVLSRDRPATPTAVDRIECCLRSEVTLFDRERLSLLTGFQEVQRWQAPSEVSREVHRVG